MEEKREEVSVFVDESEKKKKKKRMMMVMMSMEESREEERMDFCWVQLKNRWGEVVERGERMTFHHCW